MADLVFDHPRLAAIYDFVDSDRSDLDAYVAIVEEVGAVSVLDIGCGTGTLACQLALLGKTVVGLDPAAASLDVAQHKPGADRVRWVHGDLSSLPELEVDLVVMTGNVAQVFLSDSDWAHVLAATRTAMTDEGWFAFETRDPARQDWQRWTRDATHRQVETPHAGTVNTWIEVSAIELPYVSFRHSFRFHADGTTLTSESTLRFRSHDEIAETLHGAGLRIHEVRGAPDRPGLELVFIAQRERTTDLSVSRKRSPVVAEVAVNPAFAVHERILSQHACARHPAPPQPHGCPSSPATRWA